MEIVRDVLQILRARGALNKTELIYAANLNYERASCIINWLIEHELITVESGKYMITANGEAFTLLYMLIFAENDVAIKIQVSADKGHYIKKITKSNYDIYCCMA